MKPIPVSPLPDEIVARPYIVRRALPGRFDGQADVLPGTRVFVRHSPFHWGKSYWVETLEGDVLAVISAAMLERDMERESLSAQKRAREEDRG